MAQLLFTCFAGLTVAGALGVVLSKNAVNAAMGLLLCLVGVAALFLRLDAAFLAFLLLLVYAGAVVALFLFIIMLLDIRGHTGALPRGPALAAAVVALVALIAAFAGFASHAGPLARPLAGGPGVGSALKSYAYPLFTTYLLPVELVGFLLLAAMLGTIALSRRAPGETPARPPAAPLLPRS